MARGRPPIKLPPEERLARRRERVKLNVQAYRARQREKKRLVGLNAKPQIEYRWVQETKWDQREAADEKRNPESTPRGDVQGRRRRKSETNLLHQPSAENQYTIALLAMLRSRFLPDRVVLSTSTSSSSAEEQQQPLTTPCAAWVVNAHELATGAEHNPLLQSMLRSLGLGLLAAERRREDIQMVSLQTYQRTLVGVSRQLDRLISRSDVGNNGNNEERPRDSLALILSCHAASMFELGINGSLANTFRHVRGLGSLIVHELDTCAVSASTSASASDPALNILYDLVEEFRLLELTFCLVYRCPSVLRGSSWEPPTAAVMGEQPGGKKKRAKTNSRRMSAPSSLVRLFGGLLHIVRQLPDVMVMLDEHKMMTRSLSPRSNSISAAAAEPTEIENLDDAFASVSLILDKLDDWSDSFLAHHTPPGTVKSKMAEERHVVAGGADVNFPSLEVASAWVYSLAIKCLALDTYVDILAQRQQQQAHHSRRVRRGVHEREAQGGEDEDEDDGGIAAAVAARMTLLDTATLLTRSIPYFFTAEGIGSLGRMHFLFPLECARRAFLHEFERLARDDGGRGSGSDDHRRLLLGNARDVVAGYMACKQFEERAKRLGFPLFSEWDGQS